MTTNVGTDSELHRRIVALARARRESIEEVAVALGVTPASIRAYKRSTERQPRPKTMRRLEELEESARGVTGDRMAFRDTFDRRAYTSGQAGEPQQAGRTPTQRIEAIQILAQRSAADIVDIKDLLRKINETLNELLAEKIKTRRA